MNAELLSAIAGSLLSLLFSYVPGASDWYGGLEPTKKRLVMLVALVLAALGAFALSCADVYNLVSCDREGVIKIVEAFYAALVANQATYLISPKK